jgi:FkbM family methyltransferase
VNKFIVFFIYKIFLFLNRRLLLNFFFKRIVDFYFLQKGYYHFYFENPLLINKKNLFIGEIKFIKKFNILKIKNCLDIGANVGNYSNEILKNSNSNVLAIEPLKNAIHKLKKIKEKNKKRFNFLNLALSNINKNKVLLYCSKGKDSEYGLSSLHNYTKKIKHFLVNNKIKVKLLTINSLFKKKFFIFDFIKIDTEGSEMDILKGATNFLKLGSIKMIQIEMNIHHIFNQNNIYGFSQILKQYVPCQLNLLSGNLVEVNPSLTDSNIYHLSNFVFVERKFFKKNRKILIKN